MRLCIATPLYPPELGGPATYAKLLEEHLPREGVDVVLVKFGEVRHFPVGIRHLFYFWRVYTAARSCDTILALDPVSTGLPALWAAYLAGKPFVVKVVGDYAWEQGRQRYGVTDTLDAFVRTGRVSLPVAFLRAVQTHVAKSARRILVPSEYLKGIITYWGIPAEKITVIYNAVDVSEAGTTPPEVTATSQPRIVTIGRLVPWKGIDGVVRVFARVRASFPEATLIVVGEGPERASLEAQASSIRNVVFAGALTHEEVLGVLADADLVVLNSTYEGLSHVLIEALTQGALILATCVGGNPELIVDGENGRLVASGDDDALAVLMQQMLIDVDAAARLRARARQSSDRFSVATMSTQTAHLLKNL